jgi:hypothetical protein
VTADRHLVACRPDVAVQAAGSAELLVAPLEPGQFPSRRLLVDGNPVYGLTVPCDTCDFFFERLGLAQGPRSVVPEALASGIHSLDGPVVEDCEVLVGPGTYDVLLVDVRPTLVTPGSPGDYFTHDVQEIWPPDELDSSDPGTAYWRTLELQVDAKTRFFEFVVPVVDLAAIDDDRVGQYEESFRSGTQPTALAISVLDARSPAIEVPDPGTHWCLAHFLLDGHHKAVAAARTGQPLRILSFLAHGSSITLDDERASCLALLSQTPVGRSSVAN